MAPSFAMSKHRRWSEPIDSVQAERLFARFVKQVTRELQDASSTAKTDATTLVSAPTRPPRRVDENTATIRTNSFDASTDSVMRRRLLGQDQLEATLEESERKQFMVELTALYRHGHMEDVVDELEGILSKYPNDIELIGSLADFFLSHGDLSKAIEMLFTMVNVYFERADVSAARRCLERIRNLEPENQRLRKFVALLKT